MEYFLNTILFSYYQMERGVYKLIIKTFAPFLKRLFRFTYNSDPFDCLQNNYNSADDFIKAKFKVANETDSNLDYGTSMTRSEGSLIIVCAPYIQYVLIFAERTIFKREVFGAVNDFWIALLVSGIINYLYCFRKGQYVRYFKRFDKWKHKSVWYSFVIAFSVLAIALAVFSFTFEHNLYSNID